MNNVSIVIPVYNEEERIAACLDAIGAQTVRPREVIVVDNNSSDNTVEIALTYPFVRLIRAKRQGVVHARNRGFNAARGAIIGRIDADTCLPVDWVERLHRIFSDESVDAVSGSISYHDLPHHRLFARIDLLLRRRAAILMGDEVFLQGANMALRKSAWRSCRRQLCTKPGLHEDFDLAIHLTQAERRIVFREELHASISARCLNDTVRGFWEYARLSPGTYAHHNLRSGRHMYPIVALALVFHLPLRALYRLRNDGTMSGYQRVNPATFID